MTWAAAAEQRFSHPIAQAVLERFRRLDRPIPALDSSKYKVGYGITVELEGRTVRVGSRRFMDQERIPVPDSFDRQMQRLHADGLVCLCRDGGRFCRSVELRTSHRSEAEEIVAGLRARGLITSPSFPAIMRSRPIVWRDNWEWIAILPRSCRTRRVATSNFCRGGTHRLLCRRWHQRRDCAEEGGCLYSLRGAQRLPRMPPDCVHEGNLSRVCDLFDFSHALERNVKRSWDLIAIPNGLCIAGVFLFGFNIWHSVAFNNLSAIAALLNGLLPLRQAARQHLQHEQKLATEFGTRVP